MKELALFCGSFATVFALSFQQHNIQLRRQTVALINATFIGMLNLLILKIGSQASPSEMMAFIVGEPLGTLAAMRLHDRWLQRNDPQVLSGCASRHITKAQERSCQKPLYMEHGD